MLDSQELSAVGLETLAALKSAHLTLQHRFAQSARNQMRLEIRLFQILLREIVEWAGQHRELETIAQRARWWEWYWYEREYGDSDFDDLTADQERQLVTLRPEFYRRQVSLWAPTIDSKSLTVEIKQLATGQTNTLVSLQRLSRDRTWDDLRLVVLGAGPITQGLLIKAISASIRASNPSQYTRGFLDFLNRLRANFAVGWTPSRSAIFIDVLQQQNPDLEFSIGPLDLEDEKIVGFGPLEEDVSDWINLEGKLRQYDDEVRRECIEDFTVLKEALLGRLNVSAFDMTGKSI
jgi:hypothetical protein